jgi:7,8-dihydro-6-hydroxymethylpterin dimethyltransferase
MTPENPISALPGKHSPEGFQMTVLSHEQIRDWRPFPLENDGLTPVQRARKRAHATGQWHDHQYMGRRWAIGCVALEVTQRCNLDCTLCYLSESSEAIKDIPLPELIRRIDLIHAHYGPGTDVQITGGDPTLRNIDDLVQIVRRVREKGMRSSFFTNGILAKREMLQRLVDEGLTDIAFHVDMTQERQGYDSEVALNALRRRYIDEVRGLKLRVFFNTTVFDGNFHDIAEVARFFLAHADVVKLASFQLQADTGRGILLSRGDPIAPDTVEARIREGLGSPLRFDAGTAGHHDCNRAAFALVANGRAHDILGDRDYARTLLHDTAHIEFDRAHKGRTAVRLLLHALRNPHLVVRSIRHFGGLARRMRADLARARGRAHKLGFFIHNFMDARHLECDRVGACSFMTMTADGPMSMCVYNAKRDQHLLQPVKIDTRDGTGWWNPLTGETGDRPAEVAKPVLTRKNARGRAKASLLGETPHPNRSRPPIPIEVIR